MVLRFVRAATFGPVSRDRSRARVVDARTTNRNGTAGEGGPVRGKGVGRSAYAAAGRVPRTTLIWMVLPPRRTSSLTVSPGAAWLMTRSSGCVASRVVPLIAVMMSPAWRPAFSAGLPATIAGCAAAWPNWSWPGLALRVRVLALAVRVLGAVALGAVAGERVGARDPRAVVDREVVGLLHGRVDGVEPDAEPRAGQRLAGGRLGEQRSGDVDRDGEADALAVAGDRGVDADDLAARVEQRAAAVAGVDRRVGLDEVGRGWPLSTAMLRPSAEMMPLVTESVNWPSGLPMAIACWPTWMVDESPIGAVGRPVCVDLDDREVGEGVDAVDRGVERAAVLERDRQLRRVARDDVVVGEDQAVRVEDDAASPSPCPGRSGRSWDRSRLRPRR